MTDPCMRCEGQRKKSGVLNSTHKYTSADGHRQRSTEEETKRATYDVQQRIHTLYEGRSSRRPRRDLDRGSGIVVVGNTLDRVTDHHYEKADEHDESSDRSNLRHSLQFPSE